MSRTASRGGTAALSHGVGVRTEPRLRAAGSRALARMGEHDPGLSALRRSLRTAIITPSLFALAYLVIGNPVTAVFAAFSPMVLMMFVDFGGPIRERAAQQLALVLVSTALVCLGSLAGQLVWLAGVATFVVAFAVLFCGVVSSALAGAATSLLISFVLAATLTGPVSAIPDRVAGWSMGGAATVLAVALMWPRPAGQPLRTCLAEVCAQQARYLRAEADCVRAALPHTAALEVAAQDTGNAAAALRKAFYATPYRPTGLSTTARALVRLVDEALWLCGVLQQAPPPGPARSGPPVVCEVQLAAAAVLERGAALLRSGTGPLHGLASDIGRLEAAGVRLEEVMTGSLPDSPAARCARVPAGTRSVTPAEQVTALVAALEPGFRARRIAFVVAVTAADIELALAARRRAWWRKLLGQRPVTTAPALSSARDRLAAHLDRHSVWLHNSLRSAAALSLAVVLAQLSGVGHSFWVVFGTLAVLRSNAVNTGQTVGRALLGTVIGFVVGVAVILALGAHPVALWVLLPFAIVLIGLEPSVTSFTAGQAGFTVVLLILFSIIDPVGWEVGLVRIEDMALGCAVSLLVGILFWPRGAGAALGCVLCEAFQDAARYLRSAVASGLRCDGAAAPSAASGADRRSAAAAARRLDDAFRGFLAERGTKRLALPEVSRLVNSVAAVRLTGDAIADLWSREGYRPGGDRAAARAAVLGACEPIAAWFETSGRALAGRARVPDRTVGPRAADQALDQALSRELATDTDLRDASAAVRMIWTADHLDALRLLQAQIIGPLHEAADVVGLLRPRNRQP
ncbi:FUSC family protein [Streptomyces sp. NPDC001068]|uniref:FUSC family protein n=1 Tax=Streptomyces sp. NPDC001068 TaxID=3364544 RepID=UPI0036B7E4F9